MNVCRGGGGGPTKNIRIFLLTFARTFHTFSNEHPQNIIAKLLADFSLGPVLCFFFVWWHRCTVFGPDMTQKNTKIEVSPHQVHVSTCKSKISLHSS